MKEEIIRMKDAIRVVVRDLKKGVEGNGPTYSAGWHRQNAALLLNYTYTLASVAYQSSRGWGKGDFVEIGTDYGLGTFAMAIGAEKRNQKEGCWVPHVFTFDTRKECTDRARARAEELGIPNATFINGTSADVVKFVKSISFAYIDGSHLFEHCYADLIALAPLMLETGVILCHDFDDPFPNWESRNGVKPAIIQFVKEHSEWQAFRIGGMALLGRTL